MLEIEIINPQGGAKVFHSLLLPDVVADMENGQSVLALALVDKHEHEAVACGAAAGWVRDSEFILRSIFVAPEYRRQGGGRMLMEELCGFAAFNCLGMTVDFVATTKEHETMAPFLTAMGFSEESENSEIYGMTIEELGRERFFSDVIPSDISDGVPFSELSDAQRRMAYKLVVLDGVNFSSVSTTDTSVDSDVSMAVLDGAAVRSMLVVRRVQPGILDLTWLRSTSGQDSQILLRSAYKTCLEKYPKTTMITFQAVTAAGTRLLKSLLPGARQLSGSWHINLEPITITAADMEEEPNAEAMEV